MRTLPTAPALSLLLLALFLDTGRAQGTVVYRDLGSFWIVGDANFPTRYNLDFNEDGQTDFIIEAGEAFQPIGIGDSAVFSYPEPPGDLGGAGHPFAGGAGHRSGLAARRGLV